MRRATDTVNAPHAIDQLAGEINPEATDIQNSAQAPERADLPPALAGDNSLPDLAARIRAEHEAVHGMLHATVDRAMAAGDLLIEAKALVKHGEWLRWLSDHCVMSERTAQLYMRCAKNRAEIEAAKSASVADLTLNEAAALALLAVRRSNKGSPVGLAQSAALDLAQSAAGVALDFDMELKTAEEDDDREAHRDLIHEAQETVERIGQVLATMKPELAQRIASETAEYSERIAALASEYSALQRAEMGLTELEFSEFSDYIERSAAEGQSNNQIALGIDHNFFEFGRPPDPSAKMALSLAFRDAASEWLNAIEQLAEARI